MIAGIGHNHPPEDSLFEAVEKKISDLYTETVAWLDGVAVASQDQADGLSNLLRMIQAAKLEADALRIAEREPHDTAIAEIQGRYNPLIADNKSVKGKTTQAITVCKAALTDWQVKVDAEQKAEAERIRSKAEHVRTLAQEAMQSSDVTNLADRARAETLVVEAQRIERQAARAEKVKPQAGHFGRAVALRTTYAAALVSETDALAHYWRTDRVSVCNALQALADQDVRAGVRAIPGFRIDAVKKAV